MPSANEMDAEMFDPVTLDQLRALIAVVEEGSFSAAARKLRRVQSAISTAMSNLEDQLGVPIWDRTSKVARLTDQGQAVVRAARRILSEVDGLRRLTAGMVMGLEASVSLCIDALFPVSVLVELCSEFARDFPSVDLRVDTQVLSAVSERVLAGAASIGVANSVSLLPGLERKALAPIRLVPVVGAEHPFAKESTVISSSALRDSVQIVLSERSESKVADQAVISPRTYRVADVYTKLALLRANLGWGNLPEHLIRDDLKRGRLVAIRPAEWGSNEHLLQLAIVYQPQASFGPAHHWLLAKLESLCVQEAAARRVDGLAPALSTKRMRKRRTDHRKSR